MKLVISDADRTLLCSEKLMNAPLFAKAVKNLAARSIPTVIASGRSIKELSRLFSPHAGRLVFIALDGALMVASDTLLYGAPIPKAAVSDALAHVDSVRGVLLCTKDNVYCVSDDVSLISRQKSRLGDALIPLSKKDVLTLHADAPIYKICIFKKRTAPYDLALHGTRTVYENSEMAEYVRADVNKWQALTVLCEALHIDIKDVVAYGDGENDREMLIGVRDGGGVAVSVYGSTHSIFSITPHHTQNVCASVLSLLAKDEEKTRMPKR